MKCEKCGRNEANFFFSSNINGNITEKNLCSECAGEFRAVDMNDFGNMIRHASFGDLFGRKRQAPFAGFDVFPAFFLVQPDDRQAEAQETRHDCGDGCACETSDTSPDAKLLKRREINALREQMRIAAEREDFEKAASLRDEIRKLEESGEAA